MRRLIGSVVLIAGVGGLGYVAMIVNASDIQAAIATDARTIAVSAQHGAHGIETQVSGRDLIATGRVSDEAARDALRGVFEEIDGVRRVDLGGVDTLPLAEPFVLTASRDENGATTVDGVVASEGDIARVLEVANDASVALTLAAGVPDDAWGGVATQALGALAILKSGDLIVSDWDVTLTGLARTPDDDAAARAILDALPDQYSYTAQITVEDDGTPLRLTLNLRDGVVSGAGKFPSDMATSEVNDLFDMGENVEITQALIPAFDPEWPDVTRAGMQALALLIDAQLIINGQDVSLTGVADPDGKSQAEALLATLPDTYNVTIDIGLWDDGVPTRLTMTWDGNVATAEGKFPAGFTPRGPAGVAVVNDGQQSFVADGDGAFTRNANAGVAALGLMTSGSLDVTADTITLTGTAQSPQVDVVMDSVFANIDAATTVTRDLTYLDDGSPAAWTLTYGVTSGARIEGRLPNGLAISDIAATLGVAEIDGTAATATDDTDLGSSADVLTIAAGYLPEVETLTYTRDGDGSALDLVVSPGVDLDLVAADLAERLPVDVAFSLAPLDPVPNDGTTRRNSLTGLDEMFRNGFWLPSLDFTADIAGCTAQAASVLERAKITFLSSSDRLDATSIRAINALAAVAQPCLDAGLMLEIGGHTDATGSVIGNEVLSFNRANAVRAALSQRGVPTDAMTTVGYGQAQPIADNETADGRAANRRTSLTWSDQ